LQKLLLLLLLLLKEDEMKDLTFLSVRKHFQLQYHSPHQLHLNSAPKQTAGGR